MFVDDILIDDRPRPGSLAYFFGGEKRVKDFLADFLRDTATGGVTGDKNLPDFLRMAAEGGESAVFTRARTIQATIVLVVLSMNGVCR
jgi:hypothetical protein